MIKEKKPRRELKTRSKRAVALYLILLMTAAILLLLLAYVTQGHAHALTASELLFAV